MTRHQHRDKYADRKPERSRSCTTSAGILKERFSETTAEQRATDLRAERGIDVHHYHCPDCGWWHVGKPAYEGDPE